MSKKTICRTFISLNELSPELLKGIASLYCEVWCEPPWLETFWTPTEVAKDIVREMKKPNAALVVATANTSMVGFSWGYEVSKKELKKIIGNNALAHIFERNVQVGYIDELAVTRSMRQNGTGKELTSILIKTLCDVGLNRIVLRTDEKALPARNLYESLGFIELNARDSQYSSRTYWILRT